MMRRVIGLSLAGLGTFLIVFAIVLPTFIVSQVIKFPLNEYETATLDATGASYFNAGTLSERSPVNMEATYTIKGDGAAGSSSTAVWNEFTYVEDMTNHQNVQIQTRTFAFNRKTGELVPYSGDSLSGKPLSQTGGLGYVFPIGTKKQTYEWYDTTLEKAVPMVYSGTATVDGIQTYKFDENVSPTQVTTLTVPGSLIGESAASVTAPEYYSLHLVYYVDPVTGAPLNVNEHEVTALYDPATNQQALTLFNADLTATPASVTEIVGLDKSGRNELTLLKTVLPIVFGALGAVALIIGIWLIARRPNEDVEEGPTTRAPELAAVPEPAEEPEAAVAAAAAPAEVEEPPAEGEAPAEEEATAAEAPVADAPAAAETSAAEAPAAEVPAAEAPAEEETPAEASAAETAPANAATANGQAPAAGPPKRARRSGGGSHAKPPGSNTK
jgi:Porin PorA